MEVLNMDAVVRCDHDGTVEEKPSQAFVFINDANVLIDPDPEARPIGRTCFDVTVTR